MLLSRADERQDPSELTCLIKCMMSDKPQEIEKAEKKLDAFLVDSNSFNLLFDEVRNNFQFHRVSKTFLVLPILRNLIRLLLALDCLSILQLVSFGNIGNTMSSLPL